MMIRGKNIKVEMKKNKDLSASEREMINDARVEEWGEGERKDFKRDYEPETLWFFVKKQKRIVAVGGLRPIQLHYQGILYHLKGICSVISLEKGKGYGKFLISSLIDYSGKNGKTLLGFTTQTEFFKKAGLNTKKDFIKRFVYRNPVTHEKIEDKEGDGIYYAGKDGFIKKILSTQSKILIEIPHW